MKGNFPWLFEEICWTENTDFILWFNKASATPGQPSESSPYLSTESVWDYHFSF